MEEIIKILVVEDDEVDRMAVSRALEKGWNASRNHRQWLIASSALDALLQLSLARTGNDKGSRNRTR
jgi:CheY-like chemotaxis protein